MHGWHGVGMPCVLTCHNSTAAAGTLTIHVGTDVPHMINVLRLCTVAPEGQGGWLRCCHLLWLAARCWHAGGGALCHHTFGRRGVEVGRLVQWGAHGKGDCDITTRGLLECDCSAATGLMKLQAHFAWVLGSLSGPRAKDDDITPPSSILLLP